MKKNNLISTPLSRQKLQKKQITGFFGDIILTRWLKEKVMT